MCWITHQQLALKMFKTANQQLERRVDERTAELESACSDWTAAEITG
jgi:C4-dicarboxylate-specific signal transduction histidine kinase